MALMIWRRATTRNKTRRFRRGEGRGRARATEGLEGARAPERCDDVRDDDAGREVRHALEEAGQARLLAEPLRARRDRSAFVFARASSAYSARTFPRQSPRSARQAGPLSGVAGPLSGTHTQAVDPAAPPNAQDSEACKES